MDRDDLRKRTQEFALRIVKLVDALPRRPLGDVLGRQLLKAGTSIGANYREALRASSRKHFVSIIEISLREADDQQVLAVVDQVTTLTLSAALELWGKLRLGLALPLHSLDGDRLAGLGQDRQFAAMAAGDLRLGATWNIYRGSRLPLAVALGLLVTLPTGDDSSFASFGRVGFAPRLLLAYAPLSWLRLLGQVGGSFGQTREFYGTMWGRRLLLGLGLELGLPWIPWVDRHLSLVAEAESNPGFSDDSDPPLELRGGVRLRMQRWHLLLSAGGGLGDGVTVPGWRVTLGASVVLWGVKTKPGS